MMQAPRSSRFSGGSSRWVSLAAVGCAATFLAGCQSAAVLDPGPHATDPVCAQVLVGLQGQDSLAQLPRREVTAQSTAAFGKPAVTIRCGVQVPGPSTEGCLAIAEVDWLGPRDPLNNDRRYVTYGRSPAVEVFVPAGSDAAIEVVLSEVAPLVQAIPQTRKCT